MSWSLDVTSARTGHWQFGAMGDAIDLTGDGGVLKTIVRQAKANAVAPKDDLPLVDGMCLFLTFTTCWYSWQKCLNY